MVSRRWSLEVSFKDGQMAIGWQDIAGATYFFNGKGQMQSGRWLRITDEWNGEPKFNDYYLNNNGKMQTGGWFHHDNTWYYIQSNGARRYNELAEIGGQKYLFDKDGKMLTGLQVFNGKKMLSQVVALFKQKVALQVGKNKVQAGIIMMKMVFEQLVKRISTALPITLIKMVSCKLVGP